MSTVVKDLGAVSAYAYAVEKGYTGTEAEFAELMADYAEVGQRAEDAADSALESKTAAQTAATTATNKASEATTAATTATTKAAEAQADADAAALDASQALSAASTATTKATEATTAAATATSAKTDAVAANTAAQSAKTAAQTAQTGAETAAASVQSSAAQIATNAEDISQLKSDLDKTINPKNDYALMYVDARPDNLINTDDIIEGYYINTDGTQRASSDWNCTPFIDISGYSALRGQNLGLGAYYDSNKAFLSSVTIGNSRVTPPSGAAYYRASILPANIDTAILSYHDFYGGFSRDYPTSIWKNPKKAYEPGFIRFTVPVNNTVATYDTTAETNNEGTPNYVDVDCILSLPYKYKPVGEPCKLIMMCHGAGRGVSGADNWTMNENYLSLVSLFVSRGYAVFDCNGFKNDVLGWSFWGNQRGVEAWRKAYLYVTDNYNVEKTFSIYAFSMGGLTAMNLAFQGFPNINAIAMGSPVLNLREVWNATDGTQAVLKVLYGLGDEWDESKVVGNNPYKHVMTIDGTDYCPYKLPPIKIWYGSTETNNSGNPAIEKEIARSFVNAIVNSGGYAFYREVSGRGHEICYGGSTIVNTEILTYLERYEKVEATFY